MFLQLGSEFGSRAFALEITSKGRPDPLVKRMRKRVVGSQIRAPFEEKGNDLSIPTHQHVDKRHRRCLSAQSFLEGIADLIADELLRQKEGEPSSPPEPDEQTRPGAYVSAERGGDPPSVSPDGTGPGEQGGAVHEQRRNLRPIQQQSSEPHVR